MLIVLTGPVRSGKSAEAMRLAIGTGLPVVLAVGGREDDAEMRRRIARHKADRPAHVSVVEAGDSGEWLATVPSEACLVVDCLGTVLGRTLGLLVAPDAEIADETAEERATATADALVAALIVRQGPTVVVTNEVGWGLVPATPLGRLFRDTLGRANRALVEAADCAWLVVSGRCIDLTTLPREVSWPKT